jgi:hypothetical protein
VAPADPARQLEAARWAGQLEIGEDDVDPQLRAKHRDGVVRAPGFENAVAAVAQILGDDDADENLVIDDENGRRLRAHGNFDV